MTVTNMPGRRFGRLTVVEDSGQRLRECIQWRCRCDCGNEILLTRNRLTSGTVTDCGCISKEQSSNQRPEDLTGQHFGELLVLSRADNDSHTRSRWLCRCTCGKECVVPSFRLKSGLVQSCGHLRNQPAPNRIDLTGRRFGRLTVQHPSDSSVQKNRAMFWHCLCDCGREVDIMGAHLLRGVTLSCGCLNQERRAYMHDHLHYEDDTCLERLIRAQKNPQQNTSGFRGVSRIPSGHWRATITFRKVHYSLGCYSNFQDAVDARMNAEQNLHAGYLKARDLWNRKAEADPKWADTNPFFYKVTYSNQTFVIHTNGTSE